MTNHKIRFAGRVCNGWGYALVACVYSLHFSLGQEVPPIPSLKPAPPAHWTITYQDRGTKAATKAPEKPEFANAFDPNTGFTKGRQVLKEEYLIGNNAASLNRTNSDGSVDMTYLVQGVAYLSDAHTKLVRAEILSSYSGSSVRFAQKYPGFDWLAPEFFVNEQEKEGHKYLHFQQSPAPVQQTPPKDVPFSKGGNPTLYYNPKVSAQEREAWIDEETGLPYAFRRGTVFGMYQHQPPASGEIKLPPEIEKAVRVYNGYN